MKTMNEEQECINEGKNIVEQLLNALHMQEERNDHIIPEPIAEPEKFFRDVFPSCTVQELELMGCRMLERPKDGSVLMVFPKEWLPSIPKDLVMETALGKPTTIEEIGTDQKIWLGMLPFGLRIAVKS